MHQEAQHDPVERPRHYNNGSVECIDAMKAMADGSGVEGHAAYLWQNAFKYMWRWPYKAKRLEDLRKCAWYLQRLIKTIEIAEDERICTEEEDI